MNVSELLRALQAEITTQEKHLWLDLIYAPLVTPDNPVAAVGLALQQQGYLFDPTDEWTTLTPAAARNLFTRLFTISLAYASDLLPITETRRYWAAFGALLSGNVRYYTNIYNAEDFQRSQSYGSFPVTENTFDVALFLVDAEKAIGLIVIDED